MINNNENILKPGIVSAGVYKIFNVSNSKIYIGSSSDLFSRFNSHQYCLEHDFHSNKYLLKDFQETNNPNMFEFTIIEFVEDISILDSVEQKYLDIYYDGRKLCYNILPKAYSGRGYKHTEEAKKAIGEKNKINMTGKKASLKTRQKLSESLKGKPKNITLDGLKKKQENWQKHKDKMVNIGIDNSTSKKVHQLDISNSFIINTFDCINDAQRQTKTCASKITMVARGKRNQSNGFKWQYVIDTEIQHTLIMWESISNIYDLLVL